MTNRSVQDGEEAEIVDGLKERFTAIINIHFPSHIVVGDHRHSSFTLQGLHQCEMTVSEMDGRSEGGGGVTVYGSCCSFSPSVLYWSYLKRFFSPSIISSPVSQVTLHFSSNCTETIISLVYVQDKAHYQIIISNRSVSQMNTLLRHTIIAMRTVKLAIISDDDVSRQPSAKHLF